MREEPHIARGDAQYVCPVEDSLTVVTQWEPEVLPDEVPGVDWHPCGFAKRFFEVREGARPLGERDRECPENDGNMNPDEPWPANNSECTKRRHERDGEVQHDQEKNTKFEHNCAA